MFIHLVHTALVFTFVAHQQLPATDDAPHASGARLSRGDSSHVLRAVRGAQSAFENFRRARLPQGWSYGGGSCDTRIGRYCYWRGDEDDETPPPEASNIRDRRDQLTRLLDSAAHLLPGDEWIAGQRVRYLTEAGRTDAALRAGGSECRAPVNWCSALAGYAAHVGGRFETADSAYATAIAAMGSVERCRWFDISDLVSDAEADRLKTLGCRAREAAVRRLLWLGAPLYSVAGTDLLTEHFARLTRVRLSERATATDGEIWGDDTRRLVERYGWSSWYTQALPGMGWADRPAVTGHDAGVPYDFFPSAHALDSTGLATPNDWHLDAPRARSGYAPSYARTLHSVPHQIVVFRRGDSALVVAAWDASGDPAVRGRRLNAALVVADGAGGLAVSRADDVPVVGNILTAALLDSGIISLELLAPADRRAMRARRGLPPRSTERIALSDILIYTPGPAPPLGLRDVAGAAVAGDAVASTHDVGIFWEAYGLSSNSGAVEYVLSVSQLDVGWLRRAAARVHLADAAAELHLKWHEVPVEDNGIAPRALRLDLSRLRRGRYRVALSVIDASGNRAIAARNVQIR